MRALHTLAEPGFAHDWPIQLKARTFGLLIAAYALLYCLSGIPFVFASQPGESFDTLTRIQALIGAALPQIIAAIGGVRMFSGDARGKRLVVFSIALGLVYSIGDAVQSVAYDPLGRIRVMMDVPAIVGIAAFLYYLVVTSQFSKDTRSWRIVLSMMVTIFACAGLLLYAGVLFA